MLCLSRRVLVVVVSWSLSRVSRCRISVIIASFSSCLARRHVLAVVVNAIPIFFIFFVCVIIKHLYVLSSILT